MARKADDEARHRAGAPAAWAAGNPPAFSIGIAVLARKGHGTGARAALRHAGLIIANPNGSFVAGSMPFRCAAA
jgi:hypothetical protein